MIDGGSRRENHSESHMLIYFKWPLLVSLSTSAIVSVSRLGYAWVSGDRLDVAMESAGKLFFVLFPTQTIVYVLLTSFVWAGTLIATLPPRERKPKTVYKDRLVTIDRHNKERPRTIGEKWQDTMDQVKKKIEAKAQSRAYANQTKAIPATVHKPEPNMREFSLMEEIIDVTHEMYDRPTKEEFDARYQGGQNLYTKYKDIWLRLGWAEERGNGAIRWLYDEADLYRRDRKMRQIAERMGALPPPPH